MDNSWQKQIGGDHYKKYAIQPMEYSMKNNLDPLQHTGIKYLTRFRDKGEPLKDLKKARHCIDMLIEYEGGKVEDPLSFLERRTQEVTSMRDQVFSMGTDIIGEKKISKLLNAYEMVLKDVKSKL